MNAQKVITRFPPSPTGFFHIGSARTALFNYLFARHHGGEMIFRLEDTDTERNTEESAQSLIDGMRWLGIEYDNKEIPRQSDRLERYQECLKQLIKEGHAYEAEASKDGEGNVVRFKNPNKDITFADEVRGEITFNTTDLGDFVIARNTESPLYHLTVVVDDMDMSITHVIRGEEHISNTPRQILILEALGASRPVYGHIPLILNDDRSKMSKRKNAVDIADYKKQGYFPEAIVNFIALLGWNPGTEQELFTIEELIKQFDLSKVQKGGAIFNKEKLRSINKHYLGQVDDGEFGHALKEYVPDILTKLPQYSDDRLMKAASEIQERIHVFSDITELAQEGELDYYFMKPEYKPEGLVWKKSTPEATQKHLQHIRIMLEDISEESFTKENIKKVLWDYATEEGRGDILWPMRYALSGCDKSPDPFTLAEIVGKEETHARLHHAYTMLG